ncbi:hypothetical protein [Micromonospora avicenniae]|uniref:Uncharacterized protein n=1 Tax=Micromonospora avicenniae TaxID=1198245 RepID=A0A1N7AEH1_9ACTN|nr:hypothetical protein [Micromonospora avicenniae]SIR37560.1 hypothetical protein SAMN05444858_10986 [Micromonospora avicenniae]
MRDDDLSFVELVHRDLQSVRWAESSELRARARRRSRQRVMAAAVAVLVLSGVSVTLVNRPGGAGMVTANGGRAGASSSGVPAEALLSKSDLPVPVDVEIGESGARESVRVDPLLDACARDHGLSVTPVVSRYSRSRSLVRHLEIDGRLNNVQSVLTQDLYRVNADEADRILADLDRSVSSCPWWRQPTQLDDQSGATAIEYGWQVVARDFAGDRALLLRRVTSPNNSPVVSTRGEEPAAVLFVVRVGDLVAVGGTPNAGVVRPVIDEPQLTDDQLRELARTVAGRMCADADRRC